MSNKNPILVTGAHRSGTTWVGRMLAAGPHTAYISEPLNALHRAGVYRSPVRHWYPYITKENESEFLPAFLELLDFRYHLLSEVKSIRSRKDFLRMGRDLAIFTAGRLFRKRILIKDPFAVFSSPWFSETLNCRILITVRHPAGVASSLKRLNWPFDFRNLLDQPMLMQDHLEMDRAEMQSIENSDIVGQSALLWRMVYRVVEANRKLHSEIRVVRHEDLSLDPLGAYQSLYESLELKFDRKVKEAILNSSRSENPPELSKKKIYSVKLDSRANMDNWKKRLSVDEITRIRRMTEGISQLYYSDEEWK